MARFLAGLFALLLCAPGVGLSLEEDPGACYVAPGTVTEAGSAGTCTATATCGYQEGIPCQVSECSESGTMVCCLDTERGGIGCWEAATGDVSWIPLATPTPEPQPEPPKGGGLLQEFSDWVGSWFDREGIDWQSEPDLREVVDHSDHGGIDFGNLWPEWEKPRQADRPRGGVVLGDFEPPEDETPTYPPDPHPFPECPEGDVWTCPKGQPFPDGCVCLMWPDGRSAKLVDGGGNIEWISPREGDRPPVTSVSDLFHVWGMFDTEDGVDDPTPTLEDPTEKLLEQIGWRGGVPLQTDGEDPTPSETPTAGQVEATPEPTPAVCPPGETPTLFGFCIGYWTPFGDWRTAAETCTVDLIDQPVSVENPDGSGAAYLGGCEVTTCPGAEPVTECCTGENVFGAQTCETVDPNAELTPYDPPESIWEALEWLLTLPGSGEVPAGWEGPWRFYLFTSATEGR